MRLLGLEAVYQKPKASKPAGRKVYPYLLRDLVIARPNQVWCSDVSYIPMAGGFLYLVAVMGWFSRYMLSWRLSTSLLPISAWTRSMRRWTAMASPRFSTPTKVPSSPARLSRRCCSMPRSTLAWTAKVGTWRSLKYEEVYLHAYETVGEAKAGIGSWINFCNVSRPHQVLGCRTPTQVFVAAGAVDMMDNADALTAYPQQTTAGIRLS